MAYKDMCNVFNYPHNNKSNKKDVNEEQKYTALLHQCWKHHFKHLIGNIDR